jgi:hypothetical protein
MPPQPGEGLGAPPPPIPRPLPKGFEFRRKWSHNILALVGGIFFLVGSVIFLAFPACWSAGWDASTVVLHDRWLRHAPDRATPG